MDLGSEWKQQLRECWILPKAEALVDPCAWRFSWSGYDGCM